MQTSKPSRRRVIAVAAATLAGMAASPSHAEGDAFAMTSIALYLPEEALRARGPTVDDLVAYIKALTAKANEILAAQPRKAGASGALVFGLKPPARSRLWVMVGDASRKAQFAALLKAPLEAMTPPRVFGLNAFAINFDAWGGGKPLDLGATPLPVPEEWRRTMPDGGLLPDTPLKALWPD